MSEKKYSILIIDDEEAQRESIAGFLAKKGYLVHTASAGKDGIDAFSAAPFDLVLTDYRMPDVSGKDVLTQVRKMDPDIPVVVVTAFGSIESAVELMKIGAFDYLQKPIDLDELILLIKRAEERGHLLSENRLLREQLSERYSFDGIISNSGEMENVLNTAGRVAKSRASVLLRGESGTGKELIARAIHFASDRKDRPFVVVNCAALPESLFETELFGHEKGAFTGAERLRIGKFEQADGGTLFIDEVGDIPLMIQVKLLRALQFGQIERIGGEKTLDLDVRIIAATNRDLEHLISSSEFREDLYYRLNVVTVSIPPLRQRRSDIAPLVHELIRKYATQNRKLKEGISSEAMQILQRYDFPGNVRELENIIQRAVVLGRDSIVTTQDLPPEILGEDTEVAGGYTTVEIGDLNKQVAMLEDAMIRKALEKSGGNQVRASEMLNISERTLRYKLAKSRGNTD